MILFTNKNYTQSFIYTIADATEEKKKKTTHFKKTQKTPIHIKGYHHIPLLTQNPQKMSVFPTFPTKSAKLVR